MSELMPRGVEAKPFPTLYPPVDGAGTEPPPAGPGYDPAAAEVVVRSYHHRLGRPPSLDELRAALGLETDSQKSTGVGQNSVRPVPMTASFVSGRNPSRPAHIPFSPTSPDSNSPMVRGQTGASRAGLLAFLLPTLISAAVAQRQREAWLNSLGVDRNLMAAESAEISRLEKTIGEIQDAVRARHGHSFETYAKRALETRPCRYSENTMPTRKCVYFGHDSGIGEPEENVMRRYADRYPSSNYENPVLDQTSDSFGAIVGQEGRGIDHYRKEGRSDNLNKAFADHNPFARYYRFKALQEFGRFQPPIVD